MNAMEMQAMQSGAPRSRWSRSWPYWLVFIFAMAGSAFFVREEIINQGDCGLYGPCTGVFAIPFLMILMVFAWVEIWLIKHLVAAIRMRPFKPFFVVFFLAIIISIPLLVLLSVF